MRASPSQYVRVEHHYQDEFNLNYIFYVQFDDYLENCLFFL